MSTLFAIGDIHGMVTEMDRVLDLIDKDPEAGAPVVFLGDYVDRGPDSAGVIDRLIDGQDAGRPWIALAGNHDLYLHRFLDDPALTEEAARAWLSPGLGGMETLASYGIDAQGRDTQALREAARNAVPRRHRDWLASLPRLHETERHICVHAGIRPGVLLPDQDPPDLVTIRDGFLDDATDHGRLVVHGHTAAEGPRHAGNRVNLDGGAGFGRPLCAALIAGSAVSLLTAAGRAPLRPETQASVPTH